MEIVVIGGYSSGAHISDVEVISVGRAASVCRYFTRPNICELLVKNVQIFNNVFRAVSALPERHLAYAAAQAPFPGPGEVTVCGGEVGSPLKVTDKCVVYSTAEDKWTTAVFRDIFTSFVSLF